MDGPDDWQGQKLPFSCCHTKDELTDSLSTYCVNAAVGKYVFHVGCYEKLKMKVNGNTTVLIGVGIGIAFVEVDYQYNDFCYD